MGLSDADDGSIVLGTVINLEGRQWNICVQAEETGCSMM